MSIELLGADSSNHYNLNLNGNTFTFNGIGKNSKIADLDVLLNTKDCGIIVNNQTLSIDNTNFTSDVVRNGNGFLSNRNGTLNITNSNFTGNFNITDGGAIHSRGTVVMDIADTVISKNLGDNGGGIYLSDGTADILRTKISDNKSSRYGGAIYVNDGTVNISESSINNNSSGAEGGALYIKSGSDVTLDKTTLDNNSVSIASRGGAISNSGNLTIKNGSSFTNNTVAEGSGGAIVNSGILNIDNTLFENNTSKQDGGAITDTGTLTISNSIFRNNKSTAYIGGAIATSNNLNVSNTLFENNSSYEFGGAISVMQGSAKISDSIFSGNSAATSWGGGAVINYMSTIDFENSNTFKNNSSGADGGAITATTESVTNISGTASFINNSAPNGLGGGIYTQGVVNINANNPSAPVVFEGNTDSTGSNAFHLDIYDRDPIGIGTMNFDVSNGSKVIIADNISGIEGTKLNIKGTSSYDDKVYFGSSNENFKGDITTNNIDLNFYNELSGIPNAKISAVDTHFNLMNGFVEHGMVNLDVAGGGNSLSLDVDPAALTCDYINITGAPESITQLMIRDITVLSDPIQSVTVFDIFDHDKYGTDLALSDALQDSIVYGALKTYKWALTPKLTLIELGGLNPNIQRYQAATSAAFMNQMLSYDYSLNRTDEIYTNLRAEKLALRKQNSYAFAGPGGVYVNQYYEDGSAFWMRPYVNLEEFHLSGAYNNVDNQSYGVMMGYDFPMRETENGWKLFPTVYGSYIGSSQQFSDSDIHQNGGYGGFLLSAFKDDFYTGWTINGGGLGVESKYNSGKDNYAIVTAGTALKMAYNWKLFNKFILQPNVTTAYTFLNPSSLVNFQSVDMNQSQVNGLTIAPSIRLTYRNEEGFEPYIFGGCVIPAMSDIKASADGTKLDTLTLNTWAQFGAGIRKRISDRVTAFAETVIRTGGRVGWGLMFNIQISI